MSHETALLKEGELRRDQICTECNGTGLTKEWSSHKACKGIGCKYCQGEWEDHKKSCPGCKGHGTIRGPIRR